MRHTRPDVDASSSVSDSRPNKRVHWQLDNDNNNTSDNDELTWRERIDSTMDLINFNGLSYTKRVGTRLLELMLFETQAHTNSVTSKDIRTAAARMVEFPDMQAVLEQTWALRDAWILIRSPVFKAAVAELEPPTAIPTRAREPLPATRLVPGYHTANLRAWKDEYKGQYHLLALDYIAKHSNETDAYGRFMCIVQSSGMGKSRLVDEMSKLVPTIPINLRPSMNDTGFPPADTDFRFYFAETGADANSCFIQCSAFLTALFIHTTSVLQTQTSTPTTRRDAARMLYDMFADGMTFDAHGQKRRAFAKRVTDLASELVKCPLDPPSSASASPGPQAQAGRLGLEAKFKYGEKTVSLVESANNLDTYLQSLPSDDDDESDGPSSTKWPHFIVAFDEAHRLNEVGGRDPWFTMFTELLKTLTQISKTRIFFLFLSRTAMVQQYPPPRLSNSNTTLKFKVIPPFTVLGFGQFAQQLEKDTTIKDVTTRAWMASLGRPLFAALYAQGNKNVQEDAVNFAAQKLCGGRPLSTDTNSNSALDRGTNFAAIAARIPFDFHATVTNSNSNSKSPATTSSIHNELAQVEKHLRVCIKVPPNLESFGSGLATCAPSEPLVAEAAALLWRKMENTAMELLNAHTYSGTDQLQDDRDTGETVGMYIVLAAVDSVRRFQEKARNLPESESVSVSVVDFLKALIADNEDWQQTVLDSGSDPTGEGARRSLRVVFEHAHIYCTHFIRVSVPDLRNLSLAHMLEFVARGAFIISPSCSSQGLAIGVGVRDWRAPLGIDNLVFILFQFKNWTMPVDSSPAWTPFDGMGGLYELGICDEAQARDIPVIRIVMQLGAPSANVSVRVQGGQDNVNPDQVGEEVDHDGPEANPQLSPKRNVPTYDIWFTGASSNTFECIKKTDNTYISQILNFQGKMASLFNAASNDEFDVRAASGMQEMYPCGFAAKGHWKITAATSAS